MSRFDSTADDGDVGDSNLLHFGSVAAHGDGADVEFLMNHEVVALLETVASKREGSGEDAGRMRAALDFCKERTHCTELGPGALQSFCRSVRGKLQMMADRYEGEDGEGQRLHPFEVAQLANLIDSDQAEDPNDPASQLDECRAVIPSLARFSEEFLVKEVLATLKREREELTLGPTFAGGGDEIGEGDEEGGDAAMGDANDDANGESEEAGDLNAAVDPDNTGDDGGSGSAWVSAEAEGTEVEGTASYGDDSGGGDMRGSP